MNSFCRTAAPRRSTLLFLVGATVALTPALAQSPATTETAPAGERRERRWPNAGEIRERMSAALREQFQVEDDEEWKLIYERIERVAELRRSTGAGGPMGAAMAFRAARGGGTSGDAPATGGGRGGLAGLAGPETESLVTALRANAPEAEIRSRLERLRAARKANEVKLATAQEELRSVLNLRQEAIAVTIGLLP